MTGGEITNSVNCIFRQDNVWSQRWLQYKINNKVSILPKLWFDYIGGLGNSGQPVLGNRFYSPYKNNNFNNSTTFRGYLNFDLIYDSRLNIEAGAGKCCGRGAVKYRGNLYTGKLLLAKKLNKTPVSNSFFTCQQ